ncbi:ABC transporter permease [Bacillus sp. DNRA2]|uniref:ABC transporter permease n=1 Tax=Bacillus sp. DNRA2 TaxID=2723053 RepID=UPI00145DCE53|nr:ABC transporter permease [Bacillus sp. DNRA2]NMD70932.1 ABC transporter permease [Bacillus sp. DNRA2]
MKKIRIRNFIPIILPVLFITSWFYITEKQLIAAYLIPSPLVVFDTIVQFMNDGTLYGDTWISLSRMLQGFVAAIIVGVSFGIIMGLYARVDHLFAGVFNAIRVIPPLAWIPIIILWFGIGETSKIIIIFKSAFFPILLNTIQGIEGVPKGYLEVSKLMGVSKSRYLFRVILPAALPAIFVGLRLGLGAAWMAVVAAELIASDSGLGYRITQGRELSQPDVMVIGMVMIGLIGVTMDALIKLIQTRVLSWQPGIKS